MLVAPAQQQDLRFRKPVGLGDTVTVTVTALQKRPEKHVVLFDCRCMNQNGDEVITGTAQVIAPTEKISRPRVALPEVEIRRHDRYEELIKHCAEFEPIRTAVVDPRDHASLEGAVRASEVGPILPVLVGPEQEIRSLAAPLNIEITGCDLIDAKPGPAAAAAAVALARAGKVEALMKGSLRPDELMHEVVAAGTGLRTERRMSYAFVMEVPNYATPLIITDAGVNIFPTLAEKRTFARMRSTLRRSFASTRQGSQSFQRSRTSQGRCLPPWKRRPCARWLIGGRFPAVSSMGRLHLTTQ